MNVADLKALIQHLPDDTPVLVPGTDHSFNRLGNIAVVNVIQEKGVIYESYGYTSAIPFKALIIGPYG